MRAALALARRGLGAVSPNPAVGCVLVQGVNVIGRGWTQPGGRPHAETEALRRAGDGARGATAYITLEPCAHQGETPPCTDALIASGITRALVAHVDPDPRVDGGGIEQLRKAGIDTDIGLCGDEAAELNAGFFLRIIEGRPLVTLKVATSLDGRIATHSGDSKWITGEAARGFGHGLRASHDAVLVGAGTAVHDDPMLTCRLPGMAARSPVRIVVDGRMRLPLTHELVKTARDVPTWMITFPAVDAIAGDRRKAYAESGVELIDIEPDGDGNPDPEAALRALAARGINSVLVEGGGRVAAALLKQGLVDRLVWFRAPRIIGGDGIPVAAGFGVDKLPDAVDFSLVSAQPVGEDVMETYRFVRQG
jgi:diaminohydroxyphosphoribosylaminopyrimidine deaminase/5-amino-6-(5-phosphoribosylamino)uracil reductase